MFDKYYGIVDMDRNLEYYKADGFRVSERVLILYVVKDDYIELPVYATVDWRSIFIASQVDGRNLTLDSEE